MIAAWMVRESAGEYVQVGQVRLGCVIDAEVVDCYESGDVCAVVCTAITAVGTHTTKSCPNLSERMVVAQQPRKLKGIMVSLSCIHAIDIETKVFQVLLLWTCYGVLFGIFSAHR